MKDADGVVTFGLQEVLAALGNDLIAAEAHAAGQGFGLTIEDAEVELTFTIQKKTAAGGRLSISVFGFGSVGADASRDESDSRVHRIKLRLTPRADLTASAVAGGREVLPADEP